MLIDRRLGAPAIATASLLLMAGCSSSAPPDPDAASPTPHGFIEGAEETAEPQWRLVMADAEAGVHIFDPATEESHRIGELDEPSAVATDGRFVYFTGETGTDIVDSGSWTVDHGDHVHYYRTDPGIIGRTGGTTGATTVTGDPAVSVLNTSEGAVALDREALEAGDVRQAVDVKAAAALPYAKRLLVVGNAGDGEHGVQALNRDGDVVSRFDDSCPNPRGQAITHRGAVFACQDGALLITGGEDDELTSEKIPYPDDAEAGIDGGFAHRHHTSLLAARTGDGPAVFLDVADTQWTTLGDEPAVAVSGSGEDSPVLVLTADGVLHSHDPDSGEELASTALLELPDDGPPPTIQVDTMRAYINDPTGKAIYEIDYHDDLRLARTFELNFNPDFMIETGW